MSGNFGFRLAKPEDATAFAEWVANNPQIDARDIQAAQSAMLARSTAHGVDRLMQDGRELLDGGQWRAVSPISLCERGRICPLSLCESGPICPLSLWERGKG